MDTKIYLIKNQKSMKCCIESPDVELPGLNGWIKLELFAIDELQRLLAFKLKW